MLHSHVIKHLSFLGDVNVTCSFEFGSSPCFLVDDDTDNFDWTINSVSVSFFYSYHISVKNCTYISGYFTYRFRFR